MSVSVSNGVTRCSLTQRQYKALNLPLISAGEIQYKRTEELVLVDTYIGDIDSIADCQRIIDVSSKLIDAHLYVQENDYDEWCTHECSIRGWQKLTPEQVELIDGYAKAARADVRARNKKQKEKENTAKAANRRRKIKELEAEGYVVELKGD